MNVLESAGVEIHYPEKGPFREQVKPMYETLEGTPIHDYVQRVEAVQ